MADNIDNEVEIKADENKIQNEDTSKDYVSKFFRDIDWNSRVKPGPHRDSKHVWMTRETLESSYVLRYVHYQLEASQIDLNCPFDVEPSNKERPCLPKKKKKKSKGEEMEVCMEGVIAINDKDDPQNDVDDDDDFLDEYGNIKPEGLRTNLGSFKKSNSMDEEDDYGKIENGSASLSASENQDTPADAKNSPAKGGRIRKRPNLDASDSAQTPKRRHKSRSGEFAGNHGWRDLDSTSDTWQHNDRRNKNNDSSSGVFENRFIQPDGGFNSFSWPRVSSLSWAEQEWYSDYHKSVKAGYFGGECVGWEKEQWMRYLQLKELVQEEHQEFQNFSKEHSKLWLNRYEFIQPCISTYASEYRECRIKRVSQYPRFWSRIKDVRLFPVRLEGEENRLQFEMRPEGTILELGTYKKVVLPPDIIVKGKKQFKTQFLPSRLGKLSSLLPPTDVPPLDKDSQNPKSLYKTCITKDVNAEKMSEYVRPNIVLSLGTLKCIMDNLPGCDRTWEIPVVVRNITYKADNGNVITQPVVYLGKPFVPKTATAIDKNRIAYKASVRTMFQDWDSTKLKASQQRSTKPNVTEDERSNLSLSEDNDPFGDAAVDLENLETFGGTHKTKTITGVPSPEVPDINDPKLKALEKYFVKAETQDNKSKDLEQVCGDADDLNLKDGLLIQTDGGVELDYDADESDSEKEENDSLDDITQPQYIHQIDGMLDSSDSSDDSNDLVIDVSESKPAYQTVTKIRKKEDSSSSSSSDSEVSTLSVDDLMMKKLSQSQKGATIASQLSESIKNHSTDEEKVENEEAKNSDTDTLGAKGVIKSSFFGSEDSEAKSPKKSNRSGPLLTKGEDETKENSSSSEDVTTPKKFIKKISSSSQSPTLSDSAFEIVRNKNSASQEKSSNSFFDKSAVELRLQNFQLSRDEKLATANIRRSERNAKRAARKLSENTCGDTEEKQEDLANTNKNTRGKSSKPITSTPRVKSNANKSHETANTPTTKLEAVDAPNVGAMQPQLLIKENKKAQLSENREGNHQIPSLNPLDAILGLESSSSSENTATIHSKTTVNQTNNSQATVDQFSQQTRSHQPNGCVYKGEKITHLAPGCGNLSDYTEPPSGHNVNYRMWNLWKKDQGAKSNIRLLIRSKIPGLCPTSGCPTLCSVKLEYQGRFGFESCSRSHLLREWVASLISPSLTTTNMLRFRVNPAKSSLETIQLLNGSKDILTECHRQTHFDPRQQLGNLHSLCSELASLGPGRYLLQHDANSGAFCRLLRDVADREDEHINKGGKHLYDLHANYQNLFGSTTSPVLSDPWLPIDTTITSPDQERLGRIPATFEPYGKKNYKPFNKNARNPRYGGKSDRTGDKENKGHQEKAG